MPLKESGMRFADELLLYSGQYALFYILMNFSQESLNYFNDFGHTVLLIILLVQTIILAKYGHKNSVRFFGSLIAPAIYTLIESTEGWSFVVNTGHVFFWFFSMITGGLQTLANQYQGGRPKKIIESLITTTNVIIFLFLYFLFDLKLSYEKQYAAGLISSEMLDKYLGISYALKGVSNFLMDPAHIYIIWGGLILSISLSIGRIKIITLKDQINELFGKYVDKDIRDKIILKGGSKSERKKLCVLFSDIRNFTGISENHQPEAITAMLNYYFTEWEKIASRNNGIIDKYIGDAIMILFGFKNEPAACDDAVKCSVEILERLPAINKKLLLNNLPVIENIGIGLNFGEIIIGDIGSINRLNYTVIGDNVNIASRLESLCKHYETSLIISESAYTTLSQPLKNSFALLGKTPVKGKMEEITVYKLLHRQTSSDPALTTTTNF